MHELSVALSLIDALTESLGTHPDVRIDVIHLKIGPLSGVIEPALRSAFEIAAVGTIAEGAILAIQVPPIVLRCEECGQETNLSGADVMDNRDGLGSWISWLPPACPACGAAALTVVGGRELELVAAEVRRG
jgi:hydrogenase nickel incorporation protein HypA/HybF